MNPMRNRVANSGWLGLAALVLGTVALLPGMRAADDAGQAASGAARLSSVVGQVRISQGGQVLADPAPVNSPLFAGTRIETGDDGKAEIQLDDGSLARLSPDSTLTLTSIGTQGGSTDTTLVLEAGLGYFELQGASGGPMRVVFGDSVATATGFTVIRVKMDNPPGELAVFSGNAHLERGNSLAVDLHGGQSLALNASDPSRYNLAESIEPDSWDAWNSDRDQALSAEAAEQTGAANNFVNDQNPGPAWNDLDANGNWYNVPGDGYVWSPNEAENADWDPYGNGNWMWTPGYGYVFASGYSWGYMPYQCGMWNYYDGFGWGWAPGMGAGFRTGGCHPWWRNGRYGGLNIGRAPGGYRPIPMPHPRGPIGRTPPKVISVNRGFNPHQGGLPPRTRNSSVVIAGSTVTPLRPLQGNRRYEPSQSGFVYRPANGYRGGNQSSAGQGMHPGNGYTGSGNGYMNGSRPTSNVHVAPGARQVYEAPASPRYIGVPHGATPQQNGVLPGRNNPSFTPPSGGRVNQPPTGGAAPSRNPGNYPGAGGAPARPYSPPPQAPRPSGGGYSGGGAPRGGGGAAAPRPSGGGGGGGAPRGPR